jgi:hypothetical protein
MSQSNVRVVKSRRVTWACSKYVRNKNAYKILVGKLKGRIHSEDLGVEKVKVKVKLSMCLTKHHAMNTYWGRCIVQRILDLGSRRK